MQHAAGPFGEVLQIARAAEAKGLDLDVLLDILYPRFLVSPVEIKEALTQEKAREGARVKRVFTVRATKEIAVEWEVEVVMVGSEVEAAAAAIRKIRDAKVLPDPASEDDPSDVLPHHFEAEMEYEVFEEREPAAERGEEDGRPA